MNGEKQQLVTDELVEFEKSAGVQDFMNITNHFRGTPELSNIPKP
jgi:hypothetical protein